MVLMLSTAMISNVKITSSGQVNLSQRWYGTRPRARPPITTAKVGLMKFTSPLADWNAVTTAARSTPEKSASGAMIGMLRTARPDEDGTRKERPTSIQYITLMKTTLERPATACSDQ